MFNKFKVAILGYKFKVHCIDGSTYYTNARDFRDVLQKHKIAHVHLPALIEPVDDIKGTRAILGANSFKYHIVIENRVYASGREEAVKEFMAKTSQKDVKTHIEYPVWVLN